MAWYIYSITNSDSNLPYTINGYYEKPLSLVKYNDIAALVSEVPFEEFDPTDENMAIHEQSNQFLLISCKSDVVPVAFCTIVKSHHDIKILLKKGYFTFKKNLNKIKGRYEVGAKVFCDIAVFQEKYGQNSIKESKNIAKHILTELETICIESHLNDIVIDNMILNVSLLIERSKLETFNKTIERVDKELGKYLIFRLVGPLSPYSFVSMPGESNIA